MLMYRLMLINEKICEIILMVITKVFNFFKRIIKAKLYGKAENYEEEIPKSEPDITESEETISRKQKLRKRHLLDSELPFLNK